MPRRHAQVHVEASKVDLSLAETAYTVYSPKEETDRWVVLIHGITWYQFCFEELAPVLCTHLHANVLTFDCYGRGESGTPHDTAFDEELFEHQTYELLEKLGIECADFIGFSLGGAILACVVANHGEKVKRAIFIAPSGFRTALPWTATLMRAPLVGYPMYYLFAKRNMLQQLQTKPFADDFYNRDSTAAFIEHAREKIIHQIETHEGFFDSLYSTLTTFTFTKMPAFEKLNDAAECAQSDANSSRRSKQRPRFLIVAGENDAIIPCDAAKELCELLGDSAESKIFPETGHAVFVERKKECEKLFCSFLQ